MLSLSISMFILCLSQSSNIPFNIDDAMIEDRSLIAKQLAKYLKHSARGFIYVRGPKDSVDMLDLNKFSEIVDSMQVSKVIVAKTKDTRNFTTTRYVDVHIDKGMLIDSLRFIGEVDGKSKVHAILQGRKYRMELEIDGSIMKYLSNQKAYKNAWQ